MAVAMRRPLIGVSSRRDQTTTPVIVQTYAVSQSYVKAVERNGGIPAVVPLGMDETGLRSLFDRLDGVVLTGGGDIAPSEYGEQSLDSVWGIDHERDQFEFLLARWAIESGKPLLAICRGIQVLNVALGGSLYQDIPSQLPNASKHTYYPGYPRNYIAHLVAVDPNSRLAEVLQNAEVGVNSLHHQSVKRVAPGLKAVAQAPDGVIEAVEAPGHPFAIGVQWHPEELTDREPMSRLFQTLMSAASEDGR